MIFVYTVIRRRKCSIHDICVMLVYKYDIYHSFSKNLGFLCLSDLYHFPPLLSMPSFYGIILYSVLYGFSRGQLERFLQRGRDKRPTTSDFAYFFSFQLLLRV